MKLFSLLPRRLSHFACNSPPSFAPSFAARRIRRSAVHNLLYAPPILPQWAFRRMPPAGAADGRGRAGPEKTGIDR